MKYLIFFLLLIKYSHTYSQSEKDVEEKVNYYKVLLKKSRGYPDSLFSYGNQLLIFAKQNNHVIGQLIAYHNLGIAKQKLNNYPKSNQYYHRGLKLASDLKNNKIRFSFMSGIAQNHRATKYYDSAFFYFRKANNYYSNNNNLFLASVSKMDIGMTHFQKTEKKLDSAKYYFKSSIVGFKRIKNKRFISQNLSLLAEVYFQKEEYEKALKLVQESQSISEEINFRVNFSRNYNLIARIHDELKNPSKAKEFYSLEDKYKIPSRSGFKKELNEAHSKSQAKHFVKKVEVLNEDKTFYKRNLFIAITISLVLICAVLFLRKRNKIVKKEVGVLQQRLKNYKKERLDKEKSIGNQLINLKSKAILNSSEILYVKSDGHYVEYYLENKDKPEIDRNSLNEVLKTLPTLSFIRIHKSFIVNIYRIKIINSTKVMLDNGVWINLSRTYKQQLKDILHKED